MSTTAPKAQNLSAYARAAVRAQMNDMSVERIDDDLAEVCNLEYPDDERYDHTYLVEIDPDTSPKGDPVACSCPGYSLGRYYCQHMAQVKRVLLGLDEPDADYRVAADADEGEGEDEDAELEGAVKAGADAMIKDPDADDDGPDAMTDGAGGCPHDHPGCEGVHAPCERPELCPECWEEWAAYDPEDTLLPEEQHVSVEEARELIAADD